MLLALAAWPLATFAHHSHSNLNKEHVVTVFGVVTGFYWRSPHVYYTANVAGDNGEVVEYTVASLNPSAMRRAGWDKETLLPGDKIVWEGAHDRDVNRPYTGLMWVEKSDGTRLFTNLRDLRDYLEETGGTAPDNVITAEAVKPATDISSGTWARIGSDGGRFPAIRKPPEGWPLTEIAATQVENFSEDENPMVQCIYGGPPRNILSPMSYHLSRPDEKTILINRDLWPQPRIVHLDKDFPAGEPSEWGHSVGWYEGDELVVETSNFVAEKWGMYTGIDSSDQKHLVERYSLSDGGLRLNVEITIEDPVYLSEPVTITHQWGKLADRDPVEAPCSLDNAWLYLPGGYQAKEAEGK